MIHVAASCILAPFHSVRRAVRYKILLATLFLCIASGSVRSQSPEGVLQVRVQWTTPADGTPPPAPGRQPVNPLRLLERRSAGGSLPRQRNPQVSADQILVQAFNSRGLLVDSHLIPDPRLVRAESPGPTGELAGEVLHWVDPDFLITLPDAPDLVELLLFQPRWTGTEFAFDLIGSISLQ